MSAERIVQVRIPELKLKLYYKIANRHINITFYMTNVFCMCMQDTSNYVETRSAEQKFLKKYMLSPDVTCNDGSPAG